MRKNGTFIAGTGVSGFTKLILAILPAIGLCCGENHGDTMLFSLIVATYNRYDALQILFESLCAQKCKQFEVILVDQNSCEFLQPLIDQYAPCFPLHRHLTQHAGVSKARNIGIANAQGSIIAFPDDDCWYAPHTLETVAAKLQQPSSKFSGLLVNWAESPQKEKTMTPVLKDLNRFSAFSGSQTYTQFYRKEAIKGIFFDPEFGPGTTLPYACGEDTDFLLQVLKKGHRIAYSSETLVFHAKPNMNDPKLYAKTHAYALGRMHLLRKHSFPLWFKLVNLAFPLYRALVEGKAAWPYRKAMFFGRLQGLLERR